MGERVVYKQVEEEVFKRYLPEAMSIELLEMNLFIGEVGYFGEGQKEMVEWSIGKAKGTLVQLDEYLKRNCPKLG